MKRVTIADIAREAGVSKGAASYAINGQPGVSAATRARVLAVADRLNFHPSASARALAGAKSRVVGLTLQRTPSTLGVEPFFMDFISGLELELSQRSYALLLQMTSGPEGEVRCYERWSRDRRVDGVVVCDVHTDDPRIGALERLGVPAVVIGPPGVSGSLPSVWSDDAQSMIEAVEYLAALGHRRIARVGGIPQLAHTAIRTAAFDEVCARLKLTDVVTVASDYTGESGSRATRRLLSAADRPTALIFDNDVMAIAGLTVARELGIAVPGQLSIIAWDDSPACRLLHPPLTALSRDIGAYGKQAAGMLLSMMGGADVGDAHCAAAVLVPRGSTASRAPNSPETSA